MFRDQTFRSLPCLICYLTACALVWAHPTSADPPKYVVEAFQIADPPPASRPLTVYGLEGDTLIVFDDPAPTTETIRRPGAEWYIFAFDEFDLGSRSSLTIRSPSDGKSQTFRQQELELSHGVSAMFTGPSVELTLDIGPGDTHVRWPSGQVSIGGSEEEGSAEGEHAAGSRGEEGICNNSDTRHLSDYKWVGRLWPSGCTAFLVEGGLAITAGHCYQYMDDRIERLQFNVPVSGLNFEIRPPADDDDEYPLHLSKAVRGVDYEYDNDSANSPHNDEPGFGADWMIFRVPANRRGTPHAWQGGAFPTTREFVVAASGAMVGIIGYGKSGIPNLNRAQQVAHGALGRRIDRANDAVTLEHFVDTKGGVSGGPVLVDVSGTMTAIGLHDGGFCDKANYATSFANEALWQALQKLRSVQPSSDDG